jgi:hypothetical protein
MADLVPQNIHDKVFEEWWGLECPSMAILHKHLTTQHAKGNPLRFPGKLPSQGVITGWARNECWLERANDRREKLYKRNESKAITYRTEVFERLYKLGLKQLDAQMKILEKSDLDSLSTSQARELLGEARDIGANAVRQLKDAFLLIGLEAPELSGKPDLATIFRQADAAFGLGGDLKVAIGALMFKGNSPNNSSAQGRLSAPNTNQVLDAEDLDTISAEELEELLHDDEEPDEPEEDDESTT